LHVKRPAEGVLDETGFVVLRLDLPQLLEADAILAGLAAVRESESGDQLLGERATRTLADQHVFAEQRHAGRKARSRRAVALYAHVAGDHADGRALVIVEHLARRKARIDLDAQRLGPAGQPA